jgi:hypothetical protein
MKHSEIQLAWANTLNEILLGFDISIDKYLSAVSVLWVIDDSNPSFKAFATRPAVSNNCYAFIYTMQ